MAVTPECRKSANSASVHNPAAKGNSNPYSNSAAQLSNLLGDRVTGYDFLANVKLNNLNNIPQSVQDQIDYEYSIVNAFTRLDYQNVETRLIP